MIVISYHTIMDGQVLRFYHDEHHATGSDREWMSASRNGVLVHTFLHAIPDEDMERAKSAHLRLAAGEQVHDLATHRPKNILGREIVPVKP